MAGRSRQGQQAGDHIPRQVLGLPLAILATAVKKWLRALVAGAVVAVALSCGHTLPRPAQASHPRGAFVEVPFPPPPGRVEFIPPPPRQSAVWIDGEWIWEPIGQRWAWKYGRWVEAPKGARYAPWSLVRARDGTLFYAPGVWLDAHQREVVAPAVLALARASDEDVVNPEGSKEETGANMLPEPIQSRGTLPPPVQPDAGCELDAGGSAQ